MKISSEINEEKLIKFKEREWPEVDTLHFDDKELVDFDELEIMYVAEHENGDIMGYIKIRTEMGTCEIESLIVGKNFRNMGIASQLVKKAEETCMEMKLHKVFLETGVDWEARKLYEKLGYGTVCVLENHYAGKDFALMEKLIPKETK